MDPQRIQLADRIKEANNVLVTVSANPSVDQLAGAVGLTLVLNKLGKHATAVFSGKIPDTLEFLQPDQTLEGNTDSLRDFIISLDKSKADKLRYKVEDQHVKIFITPYRVSIGQEDLEFSQGDFNVDIVIALGVHEQKDLDQAITAHGRILHDATVSSINTQPGAELGTINWVDPAASSLCEMLVGLVSNLKDDVLDAQMSTALLTGIVAETHRFSNEKTTSNTMNISAKLMTAGANQQLVATKLQEEPKHKNQDEVGQFDPLAINELAHETDDEADKVDETAADGSLQIGHAEDSDKPGDEADSAPQEPAQPAEPDPDVHPDEIHVDEHGVMRPFLDAPKPAEPAPDSAPTRLILDPPSRGGTLTASGQSDSLEPIVDPLSLPAVQEPLLNRDSQPIAPDVPQVEAEQPTEPAPEPEQPKELEPAPEEPQVAEPVTAPEPAPEPEQPPEPPAVAEPAQTLTQIEQAVDSPHIAAAAIAIDAEATPAVDDARDAVLNAINAPADNPEPTPDPVVQATPEAPKPAALAPVADDGFGDLSLPDDLLSQLNGDSAINLDLPSGLYDPNTPMPADTSASSVSDPTAPPPVPPPMMPPLPPVDSFPAPPSQNL